MRVLLELLGLAFGCLIVQVASYLLGRRVGSHQVGMFLFQRLQLLQEHIELIVTERRSVLYIVLPVRFNDDCAKLVYPDICLCLFHMRINLQKYGNLFISAILSHAVIFLVISCKM